LHYGLQYSISNFTLSVALARAQFKCLSCRILSAKLQLFLVPTKEQIRFEMRPYSMEFRRFKRCLFDGFRYNATVLDYHSLNFRFGRFVKSKIRHFESISQ